MPWTKTGVTLYHAQFSDKGRAIKGLVVRWVLFNLKPRVFEQKRRHLDLVAPWLLDHSVSCHGQHLRPYEVIDEVIPLMSFKSMADVILARIENNLLFIFLNLLKVILKRWPQMIKILCKCCKSNCCNKCFVKVKLLVIIQLKNFLRFFYLLFKISKATEQIEFSDKWKLYIRPEMF